jgi:thioredoxin-like negative regulator of GroEL
MKRMSLVSAVLLSICTVMVSFSTAAPPQAQTVSTTTGIKWHSDLKEARKIAVAENKPILVVFGAEWCTYCKKLEKQTINNPSIAKFINENFVPVHLDFDKEPKVGQILEVQSLPCTVILSPDAELLGRINGYHTPGPYQQNLTAARDRYRTLKTVVPVEGTTR